MKRLLLGLVLFGCGGADSNRRSDRAADTLSNGAVRVVNSSNGLWDQEDAWRLSPDLVLGEADGPSAAVFGSIVAIQADGDGRIYVLDGQANELSIFSKDGDHVRTVGRSGKGPGEHTGANGLLWLAPDTLLVVDQGGGRYSILTREGEYVRAVQRQLGFSRFAFLGGYDEKRVYERAEVGNHPNVKPILLSVGIGRSTGANEDVLGAGADPVAAGPDTLMLPPPAGPLLPEDFVRTDSKGTAVGFMPVPFSPSAVYHLDGRGSIWHGHGREFRIIRSTLAGDTLMEVTLDATPLPVSGGDLEDWRASELPRYWISRGWPIDMARIPRLKPFFYDIYVDPVGRLWVCVPAGKREVAFEVFEPAGRYLGRLQASGFERLTWVPPVVRADRLYLAGRDELGVERVYVFRIDR